jgi:pSer/pThr/pTyr-binding forkhead associated (FHA) protein
VALYTIWRDLKSQGELLAARQPAPITLSTLAESLALTKNYTCAEIILGREAACDYTIEDQTVSSRHARLSYHKNQWWLEDLTSTNGTLLNEDAVTTPVVITHGDVVQLGQVGVRITIGRQE